MKSLVILWADDQAEFVEALRPSIADITAEVRCVTDASAAVAEAERGGCDVALIDLQMPPGGWGGLDVIREFAEKKLDLPAIVLSGTGSIRECTLAVRLGAVDYVEKEYAATELRAVIIRAVERYKRQRPLSDYDIVRSIESRIQKAVVDSLRTLASEKGGELFRIVPKEISVKTYERMLDDQSGGAQENFLDLLDLRKLIDTFWTTIPLFGHLNSVLKPRNKDERTKWLVTLNELRKIVAHPMRGELGADQRRDLRNVEDIVTRWLGPQT